MPTIRLASTDDAADVAAIYAPACALPTSFELVPPSAAEMAARIEATTRQYPWLVLDDDGVVGYAYASRHAERAAYAWSVNVSVYVRAANQRRGVGRALYVALFDALRVQGFFKAYAGVTLPNGASTGLHEALGFTLVGVYRGVGYKLGAWHDVAWFERLLQAEVDTPGEILPMSALITSAEWRSAVAAGLAEYRSR